MSRKATLFSYTYEGWSLEVRPPVGREYCGFEQRVHQYAHHVGGEILEIHGDSFEALSRVEFYKLVLAGFPPPPESGRWRSSELANIDLPKDLLLQAIHDADRDDALAMLRRRLSYYAEGNRKVSHGIVRSVFGDLRARFPISYQAVAASVPVQSIPSMVDAAPLYSACVETLSKMELPK
jgi:hypothetical protein